MIPGQAVDAADERMLEECEAWDEFPMRCPWKSQIAEAVAGQELYFAGVRGEDPNVWFTFHIPPTFPAGARRRLLEELENVVGPGENISLLRHKMPLPLDWR